MAGSNPVQTIISRPKPRLPASEGSRSNAAAYFRPYPKALESTTAIACRLPALSWVNERYILLGLSETALPKGLDLTSPRVGRAIRCSLSQRTSQHADTVEINVALFSTSPLILNVPPYPGVPPVDADAPNRVKSAYVDGTRGCWDARRYPQLFNPRRPWLPFHRHIESLQWTPDYCEYFSPCEYFCWKNPSRHSSGGSWGLSRLNVLFSAREETEAAFVSLKRDAFVLGSQLPFNDSSKRLELYDLPFYDPLTWEEVLGWDTWLDGRDRLAYTLQYVAELKALNIWLRRQTEWVRRGFTEPQPSDKSYMGTWAPTLTSKQDWDFLIAYCVPIFVATRIPENHPLLSQVTDGNLDGDERYRQNSFDANLGLKPCWAVDKSSAPDDVFPLIPDLQLECRAEYLPSSLLPVHLVQRPENMDTNSGFLSWSYPIHLDPLVRRFNQDSFMEHISRFRDRYELLLEYPALTSNIHLLNAEKDRHPLLDVIGPQLEGGQMRKYEECYDEDKKAYYARRLGRRTTGTKDLMRDATYLWQYKKEQITIISEFPFPGRGEHYGRRDYFDDDDDDEIMPPTGKMEPDRQYWTTDKSGQNPSEHKFTWTASRSALVSTSGSKRPYRAPPPLHLEFSTLYLPKQRRDRRSTRFISEEQLFLLDNSVTKVARNYYNDNKKPFSKRPAPILDDYVSEFADPQERHDAGSYWEDIIIQCEQATRRMQAASLGTDRPMSDQERLIASGNMERTIRLLEEQRAQLHQQMRIRVFRPVAGDHLISPRPVPWRITGGKAGDVCYPVRISGIHTDATVETIFAMLLGLKFITTVHDVIIFAIYTEVDGSQTIDLGLRHCEDVYLIFAALHGVEVDGKLLEVEFIYAIPGKANVVQCPNPIESLRALKDRFKRIVPFPTYPALSEELRQHAFSLEGEIKTRLLQENEASEAEIQRLRLYGRQPPIPS